MKYFFSALIAIFAIGVMPAAYAAQSNVCFSPGGSCQEAVVAEIAKAHKSIDVAMFAFTSKEIAKALVEAQKRDVKIKITLDPEQIKDHFSKGRFLMGKGLNVKFHMGPGLMHDKFAVIDDEIVLTGSYNWTVSADKKNAENLLIIRDKDLAQKYTKQFKHIWAQSGEGQLKELKPGEKADASA